ncbi:MAG TPA: zinc ribbon domain-containing protein [Elusimicrobiales bacterium]|nr:zinc ribbon domain-containing protein [Elusimicrobiales bacterium]
MSQAEIVERTQRCWKCLAPVSPKDKFCHNCAARQGGKDAWYYSHVGIILLTLVALGPFALYLVWKSPRLSKNARLVYTVLILALTTVVCVKFYEAVRSLQQTMSSADISLM